MNEAQKWLRIDGDDGWQIIVPETDIKPHGFPGEDKEAELAWFECPCNPEVDREGKIIAHKSFQDTEIIDEHLKRLLA